MFVCNSSYKLLLLLKIKTINSKTHYHHHHHHNPYRPHQHFCVLRNAYFNSKHDSPPSLKDSSSLCVDFLIDSCGLSPEQAVCASKKMRSVFTNEDERPRSVINFFETTGFSKTHITKLVSKHPRLIFSDVENTLRPKIELFQDLGLSNSELADFIASNPKIMHRSIESHILPTLALVRRLVQTDENLIRTINRSYGLLTATTLDQMQANISLLREHGVPDVEIGYSIMNEPLVIIMKTEGLQGVIERVKRIGFQPESRRFTIAICVMSSLSESTWELKMDQLKGMGWSEEQVFHCFRTQPTILGCSSKKLKEGIEFYSTTLNWDASVLSKYPHLLGFNLKRRVFPRFLVFMILISKGIVKEDKKLITMLNPTEENFLNRYVYKYQDHIPDLFQTYKTAMQTEVVLKEEDFSEELWSFSCKRIQRSLECYDLKLKLVTVTSA